MVKTIAIIGRPNVGKSTLFNRLLGKKISIVANEPGVTRDYIIGQYHYKESLFELIDTAGIQESNKKDLSKVLKDMSKVAIEKSDAILFVLDSREELTSDDIYLSKLIRKSGKKVILVANKCETPSQDNDSLRFNSFGFGDPINISAEHNRGISDLKTELSRLEEFYKPFNKEIVKDIDNPHKQQLEFGQYNPDNKVESINGISVYLLRGALGPHYMKDWSEEHVQELEDWVSINT